MRYALVAAWLMALILVSGGSALTPGIARFREAEITHIAKGETAGDTEVWRTRVWLLRRHQTVGTGVIACVRADNHTDVRECGGTYILPRGRIQLAGEVIVRASFQITITGGTGYYSGAGGIAIFSGLPRLGAVTFYLEALKETF